MSKKKEWYSAGAIYGYAAVRRICEAQFGPPRIKEFDKSTQKFKINHGNWEIKSGEIWFRYEKDRTWYLLRAPQPGQEEVHWPFNVGP